MSNLDNPKNITGIADLLADEDEDIDIKDIEASIISGLPSVKKEKTLDYGKQFGKELEDLGRKFNLNTPRVFNTQIGDEDNDASDNRGIDDLLNWSPYGKTDKPKGAPNKSSYQAPYNLDDGDTNENAEGDGDVEFYPETVASRPVIKSWSAGRPDDTQLNRMTNEERKQEHLNRVLGNMEKNNDDAEFVQQEDDEDEMARIMEQIDLLTGNLTSEGLDLSKIPTISVDSTKKEAKSVLKILQIKNDRLRYCDFVEEAILAGAYGLENVFDGNREVFGKKIDLTGYSDTVKVKLRRMRYDTSNFVSSVMQGFNVGSGWRILLELVPSLFLYSRDRRTTAKDNLASDTGYKKAIQDLL